MLPAFGPLQSGYDHFWGFRTGTLDYYSHRNARGEDDLWDGDVAIQQSGYMTDLLGDRAVDTIEQHARDERPFLLSLHFNAPHWPWEAPGDKAESDRLHGTRLRHYDGGTQATYARMVQAMDRQVGRVLQALDAGGLSATPLSSSPATTAVSASRTPGRSPASRPNYWKAVCAYPHWSAGPIAFPLAAAASR